MQYKEVIIKGHLPLCVCSDCGQGRRMIKMIIEIYDSRRKNQ